MSQCGMRENQGKCFSAETGVKMWLNFVLERAFKIASANWGISEKNAFISCMKNETFHANALMAGCFRLFSSHNCVRRPGGIVSSQNSFSLQNKTIVTVISVSHAACRGSAVYTDWNGRSVIVFDIRIPR